MHGTGFNVKTMRSFVNKTTSYVVILSLLAFLTLGYACNGFDDKQPVSISDHSWSTLKSIIQEAKLWVNEGAGVVFSSLLAEGAFANSKLHWLNQI